MSYNQNTKEFSLDKGTNYDDIITTLKILDRIIELDNNNHLAKIEKGLTNMYFQLDLSTISLIVNNQLEKSLELIYEGLRFVKNTDKILFLIRKRLLIEIGNYFSVCPKYVLIPLKKIEDKFSETIKTSKLNLTSNLEKLKSKIDIYLNRHEKFNDLRMDNIKEVRKEIVKLIKKEQEKKINIYFDNHPSFKKFLENKIFSLENEIEEIKSKYYSLDEYKELIRIEKNYENKFISSRMSKERSVIQNYLDEKYLDRENKKIKTLNKDFKEKNSDLYNLFENKEKELLKFKNVLKNGKYKINLQNVFLSTKRLYLRALKIEDYKDVFIYAKVPGVGEMAGWPYHKNIEETKKIVSSMVKDSNIFAIIDKQTENVIGTIGLDYPSYSSKDLDNLIGMEIGYVLGKKYWGHGYMPEAVDSVINYCFKILKLDYLLCGHFISNNQSKRVIEKLNFSFIKEFRMKKYDKNVSIYIKYKNKE